MKTINPAFNRMGRSLFTRLIFLTLFFLITASAFSQACHTTSPNPIICSGTVAETFSAGNGGFSTTGVMSYGAGYWSGTTSGNNNSYSYVIKSPSYYKGIYSIYNVRAGFLASVGNKATITTVTLEVVRASDNVVLGSCTPAAVNINDNLATGTTVCIGVYNNNIASYVMFYYRFTLNITNGSGAGVREVRFDNFSYGGDSNAPLPVELTFFTAKRSGYNVQLNWETALEQNNKGFEIQRKNEGAGEFENFAFVPAKSLFGNSSEKLSYSFTDINTSASNSHYRIRQVDLDGRYKYTEIRAVEGIKTKSQVLIYPNPSTNGDINVTFNTPDSKNIQLMDINGRVIRNWNSFTTQGLKLEKMKPGIYLLKINNNVTNTAEVNRIVISQ